MININNLGDFSDKQLEERARAKARRDWQDIGARDNKYTTSIQKLAYDAELMRVADLFGERGEQYV